MITMGIDIGSAAVKAVLLKDFVVLDWVINSIGYDSSVAAENIMRSVLSRKNLSLTEVDYVVATGYGRSNVPFASKSITEISCHAKGALWLFPVVRTILDIGGQDVKAIRCNDEGRVAKFLLNDKCAAGTGRYLERAAQMLNINIEEIGPLSVRHINEPLPSISSICTVFAIEDILRLLRKGFDKGVIIAGATKALADRLCVFIERIGLHEPMIITGGVAKNSGVVAFLEKRLGIKILLAPEPQIIGALGAALAAFEALKVNRLE